MVTGAAGAIGANLAKYLIERGHDVVSILHDAKPVDSASALEISDKVSWVKGSVTSHHLVERILADYEIEFVYHLAALPIVRTGLRSALPVYQTNVFGTLSVLEALRNQKDSGYEIRMIYLSTDKVYGYHGERPYKETDGFLAEAPYENSKACAELICRAFRHTYDLDIRIVRACNTYGPGDLNSRIIPNTIRQLLCGRRARLWKDVNYVREFMYVADLCEALDLVRAKSRQGSIHNVGSGELKTQSDVVLEIINDIFPGQDPGKHTETVAAPFYVAKEIQYQNLDSTKIFRDLGWKTKTSFREGIALTVDWWKNFLKR